MARIQQEMKKPALFKVIGAVYVVILALWGSHVAGRFGPAVGDAFDRWAAIAFLLWGMVLLIYSNNGKKIARKVKYAYRKNPNMEYWAVFVVFGCVGMLCWYSVNKTFDRLPLPDNSAHHIGSSQSATAPDPEKVPILSGKVTYVYAAQTIDNRTIIFALMELVNRGAPSAAIGWRLQLKSPELDFKDIPYTYLGEELVLQDAGKNHIAKFSNKAFLQEQTVSPLQRGDFKSGYVPFEIPGSHAEQIIKPGTEVTVTFKDYTDRVYSANIVISGKSAPPYMPGIEFPFVQDPNAPQQLHADIAWDLSHFIGMSGGGGQDVWVTGFQVHGRNNLDRPILHVSGVWRSDVTNEELPVCFSVNGQRVRPEDTNGIPRHAEFDICSTLIPASDPPREGMSATKFLTAYASVTLDMTYDGKKFVHHFTNSVIWKQIEAFRREALKSAPPAVSRKKHD